MYKESKVLLAGGISEDMVKYCDENRITHFDYMENENVAIKMQLQQQKEQ